MRMRSNRTSTMMKELTFRLPQCLPYAYTLYGIFKVLQLSVLTRILVASDILALGSRVARSTGSTTSAHYHGSTPLVGTNLATLAVAVQVVYLITSATTRTGFLVFALINDRRCAVAAHSATRGAANRNQNFASAFVDALSNALAVPAAKLRNLDTRHVLSIPSSPSASIFCAHIFQLAMRHSQRGKKKNTLENN